MPRLVPQLTASATIVTPIAIANASDMDFGNVAVSAAPGTVVLDPAGARSVTGGVTLPAVTGTVTAAAFDVTGQANFTYSITLPAAATTITSGRQYHDRGYLDKQSNSHRYT